MIITKGGKCGSILFSLVFVTTIITVAGQDSYDELCQECKKHKDSYRLRGWACWTICRSHVKFMDNTKQNDKQIMGMPMTSMKHNNTKFNETQNNNSSWLLNSWLSERYQQILVVFLIGAVGTRTMPKARGTKGNYREEEQTSWNKGQSKLIEVFKKARCIFPKDIDSITRALLLQQCFSRNQAQGNETVCYEELGCFPMSRPWVSLLRPFPTPHTPDQIDVKLYLYTKKHNKRYTVTLWPNISLDGSDFDPTRQRTVFITHGFASNGNTSWMRHMKNAYLDNVDANVFLVDWGKGASLFNYLQVASNTRIVGAELARFGKYLLEKGVDPMSLHLIGHSLGSHISSYMAKNIAEVGKPGRITALDPAQPGFEIESENVRLVKDDAEFVDVLHTDAKPFIPFVGFGMLLPIGHVDFYINGGTNQPGCLTNINVGKIKTIYDLADIPVEVVSQWVSCSHGRAYDVFTSSLQSNETCLWARKIPYFANIIKVTSMGALRLFDPIVEQLESCSQDSCTTVGLPTPALKGRGIFSLSTTKKSPFCVSDEERDQKIRNVLTLGLYSVGNKIIDGISKLFNLQ